MNKGSKRSFYANYFFMPNTPLKKSTDGSPLTGSEISLKE
jgi:hypothetical protein